MIYLDSSLAVTLITAEAHTAATQAWLVRQEPALLAVSDWVVTEVASALSLKQRTGELDDASRQRALRTFDRLVRSSFHLLDVPRSAFHSAADMVRRPELGVRAADALHLAVARHHDARLCTRDSRQADAGRRLGLDVLLVTALS
ncbi:MAG TPA: type II toxin-antitoxin system VapC family toxin [Mycobacteriales bacterium]|nr:type II toxin-antitoxin system VapC family toxin [Mycobacteriales bacterium]